MGLGVDATTYMEGVRARVCARATVSADVADVLTRWAYADVWVSGFGWWRGIKGKEGGMEVEVRGRLCNRIW